MVVLPHKIKVSKCDICLVSAATRAQGRRPPLALMMLAAYLEKKGLKSEILDVKTNNMLPVTKKEENQINNQIISLVKECAPIIVGITAYCHELNEVITLAKKIKKKFNNIKIVAGGVQVTLYPESLIFKGSPIDIVVFGEGEETLTELGKKIKENASYEEILGIAFLKKGKIIKTGHRPLIENLDELPRPAYEKVDMEFYLKPNIYGIRWLPLSCFYIFTSRGCPSMCTFCVNKNLWKAGGCNKIMRLINISKVVDEVEFLIQKYAIDSLYIYDDNFLITKSRGMDFCKELKKRKINLIWGCEARVDKIDDELIKTLKEAGCVQIDFGVESGSIECLNRVKKNITIEQIENAFKICNKYKMRTFANMMFNFPKETEEDVKQTWDLCKKIKATDYSFAILTPFPGTDIYEDLKLKLKREEYARFKSASLWMVDKRFRLAEHKLDLNKLAVDANLHFNSFWHYFSIPVIRIYLHILLHSKRKRAYATTAYELGKFIIKHLIPRLILRNLTANPKKKKSKINKNK